MRVLSESFSTYNASKGAEPIVVVKIVTDSYNIYVTSKDIDITDANGIFHQGLLISCSVGSQTIEPEEAISEIGGGSFQILDKALAFTTTWNTIYGDGDELYNKYTYFYFGYEGMDFDDFVRHSVGLIENPSNDEISYTITVSDIQRITKDELFADPYECTLAGNYGYDDTDEIIVDSTTGFEAVEHDDDWAIDAGETRGYLIAEGTDKNGDSATEYIGYSSTDGTTFYGVERGKFGTTRINLSYTDDDGDYQEVTLTEFIYLDLPQPEMVYSLLTGKRYGIITNDLPSHWHAGVDTSEVDLSSFENIGGDLWANHIEFRNPDEEDAKTFLGNYCLMPYGTYLKIDQYGRFVLNRYDYVSMQQPADVTLSYDEIYDVSENSRDVSDITNYFKISWSYDPIEEEYNRFDYYLDANSAAKYGTKSEVKEIELLGLRNRDSSSSTSLDFVAQSQVKRLANTAIERTVSVPIRHAVEIEVGDIVGLTLEQEPDYKTLDTYFESFEVQSVTTDFFAGQVTLNLFASEGVPTSFTADNGDAINSIDHTGWTDLSAGTYGTHDGSTFTFTDGANIPDGKYYYDGDIVVDTDSTIYINGSVYFDCDDFTLEDNAKIDGKGRGGAVGHDGYFGGGNASMNGLDMDSNNTSNLINLYSNRSTTSYVATSIDLSYTVSISDGDDVTAILPSSLNGMGGGAGGQSTYDNGTEVLSGGSAVSGGAGICFICDGLYYQSSSSIDLSGDDANQGTEGSVTFDYRANGDDRSVTINAAGGMSGFGYPGICIVAQKNNDAAEPILYDLVTADSGSWDSNVENYLDSWKKVYRGTAGSDTYGAQYQAGEVYAGTSYSSSTNQSAIHKMRFLAAEDYTPDTTKDTIESALAPTFTVTELLNTPVSAAGNISTIQVDVTSTDDNFYYALVEYKLPTQSTWTSVSYDTSTSTTFEVASDGTTYDIRVTAYNVARAAGGVTTSTFTTTIVENDTEVSAGENTADVDEALTIPTPTALELVNRIDDDEGWNQFKSGNAEFQWNELSTSDSGSIVSLSGSTDVFLSGYKVIISDSDGNLLRESSLLTEPEYTYTYDKNKTDNGTPIREFTIAVQAVATTGYASDYVSISVENPEPSAVSGISSEVGYTSLTVNYTLPTDVDFVGVNAYIVEGSGNNPYTEGSYKTVSGNNVTWDNLVQGTTYVVGLESVDQFGTGEQSSTIEFTLLSIDAADVDGLGAWATIDEADAAFISTYVETGSIVESLLADDSVTNSKLADLAVTANNLADGSIDLEGSAITGELQSVNLADASVDTSKLADLSVEAAKLADSSVTSTKIASLAVGTAAIANAAITNAKIGDLAVDTAQISDAAITSAKIEDLAVGTAAISNLAVTDAKIGDVSAGKITAGTIAATEYVQVGDGVDSGVKIDGDGYVYTTNSGYVVTMGAVDVPTESANPLILYAEGAGNYPFWVDAAGNAKFTGSVTITGGSGVSNFSDAGALATADDYSDISGTPTSLDDINSTEYSTLTTASSEASQALADAAAAQYTADNIEVGSINIIDGTQDGGAWSATYLTGDYYNGFAISAATGPASGFTDFVSKTNIDTSSNTTFTVSFYAKSDTDGTAIRSYLYGGDSSTVSASNSQGNTSSSVDGNIITTLTTDWARYWITWVIGDSAIKNIIVGRIFDSEVGETASICGVKFESGNKATAWSPSLQDVSDYVDAQVLIVSQEAADALAAAQTAQSTADGKITSFYQDSEPTSGMDDGDIWFDTDDGNTVYRYNGSSWVSAQDSDIASAINAAQTAQTTADGKAVVYYQTTAPTTASAGDLWFNTDGSDSLSRYNGSTWDEVSTVGATWGSNISNEPTSLSDVNSTEGTKLSGIESGATVGADWNSTLSNIPDRITDSATTGLNLTSTYMGYYNGTQFETYIDSNGNFSFGSGDNSISFDGSVITIGSEVTIGDNTSRTVTVGSGYDYETLDEALEALSRVVPAYQNGGFTATIECQSGYVDTDFHSIDGINLGWITITTTETSGQLTISPSGLNYWIEVYNGGVAPILSCGVDLTTDISGIIYAHDNGSAKITTNSLTASSNYTFSGYSQNNGVFCRADSYGRIMAIAQNIEDFGSVFWADDGGEIIGNRASAVRVGYYARSNDGSVDASSSTVEDCNLQLAWASDSANISIVGTSLVSPYPPTGITSTLGSTVNAYNSDLSGCTNYCIYVAYGTVVINGADAVSSGGSDIYIDGDGVLLGTQSSGSIDRDTLVSGSVRIWCDGYNSTDALYYSENGDNFTTRTAICKASGTITVWADFSGGTSDPQCYVRRNGTTMATWSSIVGSSYSTSFSVTAGDVIYLRSNTFSGDTLTLDRWEIRSNSTEHIGLVV